MLHLSTQKLTIPVEATGPVVAFRVQCACGPRFKASRDTTPDFFVQTRKAGLLKRMEEGHN